jgi:DNA replication protein DnaC
LLQSLIPQPYKLCLSVIVTSNRVLQMGRLPRDNTIATATLDHLMHRSRSLEFEGRSYRLNAASEALARKPKSS